MNAYRLVACGAALFALVTAGRVLHRFAPVRLSKIGHRDGANAGYYGWRFDPGEPIHLRDPDNGEVFVTPANNYGWRDRDRSCPPARARLR